MDPLQLYLDPESAVRINTSRPSTSSKTNISLQPYFLSIGVNCS
jgi:hypothetical protein